MGAAKGSFGFVGLSLSLALVGALGGCSADEQVKPVAKPTTVKMSFADTSDFYASPFPSDARTKADGTVDLSNYPLPSFPNLITEVIGLLDGKVKGYGTTSGIFFELTDALEVTDLVDYQASLEPKSAVFLISVDPSSPDYLKRYPISAKFTNDAGPYGAKNLITLLPLQGIPLRPKTLYAAALLDTLEDAKGNALGVSEEMAALAAGKQPEGLGAAAFENYQTALAGLKEAGVKATDLAGLAVFTTGSPTEDFDKVTLAMVSGTVPVVDQPFVRNEQFDDFCVYQTTISMPEYQQGEAPYSETGGDWKFDASGKPVVTRMEEANFVVTIPRGPMPEAGYPVVVLSRTGAGGERPLVDRGVQAMTGGAAITPGTGPALYYAKAGFAGSEIDGPQGGLRNITHGDEQFLIFNVGNPAALRDNVRQSAAELVLQAHILEQVTVDVSDCEGAVAPDNLAKLDVDTMAIMGHSMGATISPLALSYEPRFRAGILSGAGGSWIENVIYKLHPLAVKGLAEVLVGYAGTPYQLSEWDPALSMFQWALEPADPPVYGGRILRAPEKLGGVQGQARHVLMLQGIVDHYILPPIANATSLSFGLDLAGEELDDQAAELKTMAPLGARLFASGRSKISLPATGNFTNAVGETVTAVVTQHPEDGVEDGHEVAFQTDPPKHEYICFLTGLRTTGKPRIPSPGKAFDPCD